MTVDPNAGSSSASGPQFDYGATDSADTGGSTDYDPAAVQSMITALLLKVKESGKPMTEGEMTYVMYLMQEYGLQVVGQDSNIQSQLNVYFGKVHELYTDLNNANGWDGKGVDPTTAFASCLSYLLSSLSSDPFFSAADGGGHAMAAQMSAALEGMTCYTSANGLENLWTQYNGSTTPVCVGNPTAMNTLTSSLGETTQQYTGISKSQQAVTQTDSALQTTQMNTMSNYVKKNNSCILYIAGQSKTQ